LYIDARSLGTLVDRVHRELTEDDIARVAGTYHAWRGDHDAGRAYEDVAGFCRAAMLEDMRANNHVLTPGRYVGVPEVEGDGEPFADKMARLAAELRAQQEEARRLDEVIWQNLKGIGYGYD